MSTTRFDRLRRPLIIVCLAAALLLACALGWEAVTAARAQRRAVEGVLHDYAELAAEQYARNVTVTLDYEWFLPAFRLLDAAGDVDGLPDGDAEIQGQRSAHRLAELAVAFFAVDPGTAALRVQPIDDQEMGEELRVAVLRYAERNYQDDWPCAAFLVRTGERPRLVVYRLAGGDAGPDSVEGFVASAFSLDAFLAQAVTLYALLPPTLTDEADAEDVVGVRVVNEEGEVVFETPSAAGDSLQATFDLPPRFAGLRVIASIPVASAGRLVVGGLPYSRLPLVVGMLALTLALLGVGVMLWRREQELVRLREQFVAGASHELRTPLAQIRMFAETLRLQRVRSDEEERRSLQIIDREARRLSLLVENLLQFSSAGRGPRRFLPETADVRHLARDVADAFEPLAAARGTRLEVAGDGEAQASVDRDMLRQVLVNLLDNAVKYGPDEQTITIEVTHDAAGVSIAVTDQGPGVPASERQLVWQRFWRGARADGITGTGIGLALVQDLVEQHGGTVAVEDGPESGARFVVRLPAARA